MKLREWRKSKKLTQAEVAARLAEITGSPVTHDQISRIENGQSPNLHLAVAIGRLTDDVVTPADLSWLAA